jgi:hypothetical protein
MIYVSERSCDIGFLGSLGMPPNFQVVIVCFPCCPPDLRSSKFEFLLCRPRNHLSELCNYLSVYLSIYLSMALQPLWTLAAFQFLNLYTVGRTPWTGDQPVSRSLPTHTTTQTRNKRTYRHPCLEWDPNPRSQRSSGRRQSFN